MNASSGAWLDAEEIGAAPDTRSILAAPRHVRKGERAFHILVPFLVKKAVENAETGESEERTYIRGFSSAPVFGLQKTYGEPLPPPDPAIAAWLE